MTISLEAAEAAARDINYVRARLEAAWNAGYRQAALDIHFDVISPNPYRSAGAGE